MLGLTASLIVVAFGPSRARGRIHRWHGGLLLLVFLAYLSLLGWTAGS